MTVATQERIGSLRRFNLIMAALHAAQGAAMLALSSDFSLPVTTSFLRLDPSVNGLVGEPETYLNLRIGPMVAAFLFLSAIAHLAVATVAFERYQRDLRRGINPARWIEYSASASLMIVIIAMLVGIYDAAALLLLFAVNASMILFGWMMEKHNQSTEDTDWTSFWFGVIAGAAPWLAIGIYLFGSGAGEGGPPTFVYYIYGSIFVFFNAFAVNMVLQYRARGRWSDYLYGERARTSCSAWSRSRCSRGRSTRGRCGPSDVVPPRGLSPRPM